MFDPAEQPPAETMDAACVKAAASTGSKSGDERRQSGRRYTADDFRSLMARLSKGSERSASQRPRPLQLPNALPDLGQRPEPCVAAAPEDLAAESGVAPVAQDPSVHHWEPEPGTDGADGDAAPLLEAETVALAQDPAGEQDEPEPAIDASIEDATQPIVAETAGTLPADPPLQNDALIAEPPAEPVAASGEPTDGFAGDAPLMDASVFVGAPEPIGPAITPPDPGPAVQRSRPSPASEAGLEPDIQSGETARMLLDIMAMPSGAVQPQERSLAGDTLLRLVSRMPVPSLIALCDRLCIMEAPPPLLVRRLIQHDAIEVAGPLLERCPGISDQDLMTMINLGEVAILRLIARRRTLSPALTDALIRHGDASVMLTVVRNPGAALSHEAFNILAETAKSRTALQAPLATRADTPAPIAFELFWSLPPQLRRYVLSRFLTESATLDRILKIAHALEEPNGSEGNGSPKLADPAEIEELAALVADGKMVEASHKLATLAGIGGINAERIITDCEGEPLTVAMKAIGLSRTQFAAVAETLRDAPAAPLRCDRMISELQTLFDSLSFTKARVLLTYWDWAVEQTGPYSGTAV